MHKVLHVVVACAENRVIGRNGQLPWRIPEDAEHFRQLTAGGVCVLGRTCFDTWPPATRGQRQPIVITSRPLPNEATGARTDATVASARAAGASRPIPARSLPEALAIAEQVPGDLFVCGGQRIFEETLQLERPMRLHLTLVHADVPGDRFFPEWRHLPWRELERRDSADANYRYTFHTLERLLSPS